MQVKDLIGFQIVEMNEWEIVVQRNKKAYRIAIDQDDGDCCGFNNIKTCLFFDPQNADRNPIITRVEATGDTCWNSGDSVKITFFGEQKALAELEARSYSGSGWEYGANVTLVCDDLCMQETISQW